MKNILILIFGLIALDSAFSQVTPSEAQYLSSPTILTNPGFESGRKGWTIGSGTTTVDSALKFSGNYSLKTVLSAQAYSVIQSSTVNSASFADGVQGLAMVRIKSDIALSVCAIQAGTVSTTDCVTTSTDSKWGLYKIPFILGGTSNGISIASTGSVTGTVYIDDAFVGAVDLKQDVKACTTADCLASFTVIVNSNGAVVSESSDWVTTCTNVSGTVACTFTSALTSSLTIGMACTGNRIGSGGGTTTVLGDQTTTTGFSSSSGNTTSNVSVFTCTKQGIDFTRAKNLENGNIYTTQCGANCVDTYSAIIASTTTDVVTSENVDFINGNCTTATIGRSTCTFNSGIATQALSCSCTTVVNAANRSCAVLVQSSTSVLVSTTSGGVETDGLGFNLICQKQGADFVATRTIQGTFNEVNVSPGISKPKTCYYAFGGPAATLAAPTLCTTGTCVNMKDTCGGMSTAFSSLGMYSLTVPSGTFANDSYITTTSQHGVPGNLCGAAAYLANSSGGATINIRCAIFIGGSDGVATNAHSSFVLQGSAP